MRQTKGLLVTSPSDSPPGNLSLLAPVIVTVHVRDGHYYHLPTISNIVANGQDGLWMTEFKGGQEGTGLEVVGGNVSRKL